MRTAADLDRAFAALAEQADAYAAAHDLDAAAHDADAAAHDGTTQRSASPIDLVHPSGHRRPGLRRPGHRRPTRTVVGAAVLAAAAVVELAVGVGLWTGRGDTSGPVGGSPAHHDRPAPRTYRVTLDPKLGYRPLEISATGDDTGLAYYSRTRQLQLTVVPAAARQQLTPGLTPVDLGTLGTGYYTDGTKPIFVQPPSDPATGGPGPTPTPPATRYAKAVVLPLSPGTYVHVLFQGTTGTKAQLVRIARGLVVHPTARPIPSAVSLRSAPAGMRLVSVDSTLHRAGDNPPYALAGRDWSTSVHYQPAQGGDGIAIEATSVDLTTHPRKGAHAVAVDGHHGYWIEQDGELDLDLGGGRYVALSGTTEGAAVAKDVTRAELVAIARTVTVTSYPHDPAHWFLATRALP